MSELSENRPSILIVDDDESTRIAIRAVLEVLDIEVIEAESGEAALREILRHDFAMIILDIKMRGMSGFDVASIIRGREKSKEIPIIFLTGFERDEMNVSRGYDLGAVDYMIKPIVPHSLLAKVRFSIKYHAQLLQSLEEQRRNAREQAELVKELSRSNKALDEFAYVASHDLREPLRGISINANFLLKEDLPKTVRTRVSRMIELSVYMDDLISDLLFFSRLGQRADPHVTCDVAQILEGCRHLIEKLQNPKLAKMVVQDSLPRVRADPAHVRTVFQNLVSNGLQYNNSVPAVVEVGFAESLVSDDMEYENVFFVKDNGIGIHKDFHEKIFKIFTRLNTKKEYNSGSGAGLSFVKRILEGYECSINIESELDHGTTMIFDLPLVNG